MHIFSFRKKQQKMNTIFSQQDDIQKLNEKVDKIISWFNNLDIIHPNRTYTNKELCKKLNVCTKTLQNYRDSGWIEFTQVGRKIIYTDTQVQRFIDNHRVKTKFN